MALRCRPPCVPCTTRLALSRLLRRDCFLDYNADTRCSNADTQQIVFHTGLSLGENNIGLAGDTSFYITLGQLAFPLVLASNISAQDGQCEIFVDSSIFNCSAPEPAASTAPSAPAAGSGGGTPAWVWVLVGLGAAAAVAMATTGAWLCGRRHARGGDGATSILPLNLTPKTSSEDSGALSKVPAVPWCMHET